MNKTVKKVLAYVLSIVLVIGLILAAPISRTIYSVYDANRTREIVKQLEDEAAASAARSEESQTASTFHKQAWLMQDQQTEDGSQVNIFDVLTLTSETTYELSHYEQVVSDSSSYTREYFHMSGEYTREGNMVTVQPGIGMLSQNASGSGFVHANAQFLTAEEAGGEKTRPEVYAAKYDSNQIALMSDGSFVVGGQSDASEVLEAPAGRKVYTDAVLQGRVTYKTLITLDDGRYILYSQATNSNNAEQTTGAFFGYGTYEITEQHVAPDENAPEQTYDVVVGSIGRGFMYANNNGSHMQFDLQNDGSFSQWLATSFNATSPTFYATESGCTIKIGALKNIVSPWGLYIPASDAKAEATAAPTEAPAATAAPAAAPQALTMEVASSAEGKPFVLTLNADGSVLTGWTNYEQTMKEGSWAVSDGALTFDLADAGYTAAVAMNEDGTVTITVNYGQMGDKEYTMPAAAVAAMGIGAAPAAAPAEAAAPQALTMEVASSAEGKPFVLTLNADGSVLTGWTNYEQTMKEGSWAVTDGVLTFDLTDAGYTAAVTMNEDGTATITVNYGQMGDKVYTMPAAAVAAMGIGAAPAAAPAEAAAPQALTMEVASSAEGKPFVLTLNADGSVLTGWTNYEQTMKEGSWAVTDGTLTFDLADAGYTAAVTMNEDGSAAITVNYGQMGDKEYTMPAAAVAAMGIGAAPAAAPTEAAAPQALTMEVASSAEGKPFVLTLNADGSVLTGWTNYEQTMKEGSWAVSDGALTFDLADASYTATVAMNEDGTASITVNYGQMGDKVYTMPAAAVAAMGIGAAPAAAPQALTMEVASSAEGKPFVLTLNADGSVLTGWTNYEQTLKEGSWAVTDGALTFDLADAGYTAAVTMNEDGTATITVNYGQMGDKVYTMPAAAVAAMGIGAAPAAAPAEAAAPQALTMEVASSAEGKPFVLTLNADGSVLTGWTNYEQTMKEGSWAVTNGALTFDLADAGYTAAVAMNEDGTASITVNYGQMGDKEYTMPAAAVAAIIK